MIMSIRTQANDWKANCVAQVGGAAVVALVEFFVVLSSEQANVTKTFTFTGYGLGVGGSAGGASLTPNSPSSLICDQSFSAHDLDGSFGRFTTATASLSVGYSLGYVSAFNWSGSLFSSQSVSGFSAGVGLGAITTSGFWKMIG